MLGAAAALMIWRQPSRLAATGLIGVVVPLQAGHNHAFAMAHGVSWLLLSQVMHLLAAGAWLGGLLPLLLFIRAVPSNISAVAAQRFSTLGASCVLMLAASATFQA
jgi:putative copper resistance protein D